MLRLISLRLLVCLLPVVAAGAAFGSPPDALATAAEAYRAMPRFAERFEYQVFLPNGQVDRKAMEYGRDGERVFMAMFDGTGMRMFHLAVEADVLRALQFNIDGAYVEAPYEGSLVEALRSVGADRIGLTVPPGLAASETAERAFVDAFGFGVLGAMEPASVESDGEATRVSLSGEAGSAVARFAADGRLVGLNLTLGEGEGAVRLEGAVSSIEVADDDERWTVAVAGRRAVADFAALENSGYPLGSAAPDLEIPKLGGGTLSLAEQRGRVVILDFWATWCVPCWSALEHLERVVAWAESSDLPISVWAVDTAEQTTTLEEQVELVAGFLAERGLDVPVVVDVDGSFFTGMHTPGLPSTVLIAPDGTLARFHAGFGEDMEDVLKAEALALLETR